MPPKTIAKDTKDTAKSELKKESNADNSNLGYTGLLTVCWKNTARQPAFWQQYANGKVGREKPLFKDDYMALFVDEHVAKKAKEMLPPKMMLALAVRHKFFSKSLSKQIKAPKDPVTQVVLLGSGYDTRPVRKRKYPVRFFEVDYPFVLERKKKIYQAQKIDANAVYVCLDYLKQDFLEELRKAGLDPKLPTHFIWEGNTMYLTKSDVEHILKAVATNFHGKVLISFDYMSSAVITKQAQIAETDKMIDDFKKSKAPMINGYNDIHELAKKCGFTVYENRLCADVTREYKLDDTPFHTQNHYYFCTFVKEPANHSPSLRLTSAL